MEGCEIGQSETCNILRQIQIIYNEFEFLSLKCGVCGLTLALAELCTLSGSVYAFIFVSFFFHHHVVFYCSLYLEPNSVKSEINCRLSFLSIH